MVGVSSITLAGSLRRSVVGHPSVPPNRGAGLGWFVADAVVGGVARGQAQIIFSVHIQVGSLAGAAHLLKGNAGVLR